MRILKSALVAVCLLVLAGTSFASTWTPNGGNVTSTIPPGNYSGCEVDLDVMEGVAHPKKWVITTTNPAGTLVLDDDDPSMTPELRNALQTAANQGDGNNQVTMANGNAVSRVRTR